MRRDATNRHAPPPPRPRPTDPTLRSDRHRTPWSPSTLRLFCILRNQIHRCNNNTFYHGTDYARRAISVEVTSFSPYSRPFCRTSSISPIITSFRHQPYWFLVFLPVSPAICAVHVSNICYWRVGAVFEGWARLLIFSFGPRYWHFGRARFPGSALVPVGGMLRQLPHPRGEYQGQQQRYMYRFGRSQSPMVHRYASIINANGWEEVKWQHQILGQLD